MRTLKYVHTKSYAICMCNVYSTALNVTLQQRANTWHVVKCNLLNSRKVIVDKLWLFVFFFGSNYYNYPSLFTNDGAYCNGGC